MNDCQHTVLCVDDEENILKSLKRLLRKENYRLVTACNGEEALALLKENDVHLVISDQRMPGMNGTKFLAQVKKEYPDAIRIILSGYTEVDSITEAINKGHIYKFLLKPWNDQNLKLEIRQALDQYDLVQSNKRLHKKVLEQNEELLKINENLELLVQKRTKTLEFQNQALELSRAILEDLPVPIIGVSAEGMIVLVNRQAHALLEKSESIEVGRRLLDYFSNDVADKMIHVLTSSTPQELKGYPLSKISYDIDLIPLSGKFRDQGIVLALKHQ